ncbi:MAG: NAD(P)H-dependent flavin oxidoreductase [Candidatus Binataceae bacterium]
MLKTKICGLFGIEYPIISAGMGGVALADLAAAVSQAGGLGTIGLAGFSPEAIHKEIARAREITQKPLAVNLIIPFLRPGVIDVLVDEPIEAVTFFWGEPDESVARLKHAGIKVIWQCGSAAEARMAMNAGADVIMTQGFEAGGHVRGIVSTIALVPEVRDAIGDTPMVAAGGMADGRGLAAALALGADGAVFGTRFLASNEAAAHQTYKDRIVAAHAEETLHTTLFDIGWPNAPHRVLRTPAVEEWERAGRPPSGQRPGEGQSASALKRSGIELPLVRYSVMAPTNYVEGDLSGLAFYAGQSCSIVREILPAGEIVRRIADEARAVIERRLAPLAR